MPVAWVETVKAKAQLLKKETFALGFAYLDSRTPWYARVFAALVVAYAFSPIDLIPDFIPVLGYLDDLVLIPAGIALAWRMIPIDVMNTARSRAEQELVQGGRLAKYGVLIVILIWVMFLAFAVWLVHTLVTK